MRSHHYVLIALVLLITSTGRAETLSRAEAVRLALQANPEVLKSREQLRYLDGRITEEKAAAFPDVSIRGTAYRYNDPSFLNSPTFDMFSQGLGTSLNPIASNIFEGDLDVRQTLYSFKLGKAIQAARLAKQLGGADLKRVQQQIALQTVQAYNALLYASEQVRVQQNAREQREKHLVMTRNRREAGVATELEVLRAEVSLENQKAEVTRAEGGVELARAQLNALMLRPMDSPISQTDTLQYEPIAYEAEEVTRAALENRPDLAVAELTQSVRERALDITRADGKPTFEFVGSLGQSTRLPRNFIDFNYSKWNAAFNLKFPVFDGGRRAGQVEQAAAEVGKARQDKVAMQNSIRLEAMDALVKLNVAARLISAAQMNVTQAQRALTMTQANYTYGAATVLDVTDAENALVQAETILAQALQQHADAHATVRYVMGRDPAAPGEDGR